MDGSYEDLVARFHRYLMPAVETYYEDPLVIDHARGLEVFDTAGQRFLDFFGGILTVSVGHSHPTVVSAIREQLDRMTHTSTLYITSAMVELAQKLAAMTPGTLRQSFFTSSGTEANETAVRIAQLATGSSEIMALRHGYSGRSQLTLSLTGQSSWRQGLPGSVGIHHAHNAYCYRCPFGKRPQTCGLECAQDVKEVLATQTSGRIAALIAEPIQGVGGFITPPDRYFHEVVEIVHAHGGLFIDDEVQTGLGRTGKMFGIEHCGVEPDIMTFAKGLANGTPIGATITTAEIAASYRGPTISTFGGNPVSMQAALATLGVIEEENLMENAAAMGTVLREGLEELQQRFPVIGDVRGRGLMQGLEFVRTQKEPAPDLVKEFFEATRRRGLLIGKGGLYGNTIRIAPAMTVTRTQIFEALEIMEDSLEELYRQEPPLAAVGKE